MGGLMGVNVGNGNSPGGAPPSVLAASDHPVVPLSVAMVFIEDHELSFLIKDEGARGDGVGEKNAGGHGGARSDDGVAAHDRGSGVQGDVVFDGGVAFFSAEGLSPREGFGDEGDALVEFDVGADGGGFANDDAGAMVDEEVAADAGAGVDVDSGSGVGPLGHHAGEEGDVEVVEEMGHALDGDGFEEGIGDDDFVGA
ncbi:MAG: hypothetical protein RLZZ244_2397 [Verrucomicrobiota bacterium]